MRLIFLDIDGVLNGHEKLETGYCGICPQRASRFNRLLDAVPDAQIVVSSAWRYIMLKGGMTLQGFEQMLLICGVKCYGRLVGHTCPDGEICDEPPHDDVETWRRIGLEMRSRQIERYVARYKPERYIVLDDLPLVGVENFVQTDSTLGLTDADVERAIGLLTGSSAARAAR